jgi:hypothetical protein
MAGRSVDAMRSRTLMSFERRFAARALVSVMIRKMIRLSLTLLRA